MTLKQRIYNLIREDDKNDLYSNIFDRSIIALIIINVIFLILDTFDLPPVLQTVSNVVECVSIAIFTIEYLLRLWTSPLIFPNISPHKSRLKYIFSFMAIIDLLAVLPFYIPFIILIDLRVLRTLRIIRLLRLFKLNRYTNALTTIGKVFKAKSSQLVSSVFIVFILMIIASVLMYNIEFYAQPERFDNAFSGLWWAIATITTVGYGDIYPITVAGKILSAVIELLGVGLVAVPTGIISAGFMEQADSEKKEDAEQKCYCPYCGKDIR